MNEITDDMLRRFASVYAEAVLTYLDSGEAQWLLWDDQADLFDFASVEMDQPDLPILLFVDETWTRLCEVDVPTDPGSPQFDGAALRVAIEEQIADEGLGERILKTYLQRRAQHLQDEEDAGDESDGRAPQREED